MSVQEPVSATWHGFIRNTEDAALIIEACLRGGLQPVSRRPQESERPGLIISGNVFVFEPQASNICRWTDGRKWSPSRGFGNFLYYREQADSVRKEDKKKIVKRTPRSRSASNDLGSPPVSHEDRHLHGSLLESYDFKIPGLMKKTFRATVGATVHHLVAYYDPDDVKAGHFFTPARDPTLSLLQPRYSLLNPTEGRSVDWELGSVGHYNPPQPDLALWTLFPGQQHMPTLLQDLPGQIQGLQGMPPMDQGQGPEPPQALMDQGQGPVQPQQELPPQPMEAEPQNWLPPLDQEPAQPNPLGWLQAWPLPSQQPMQQQEWLPQLTEGQSQEWSLYPTLGN